MTLKVLESYKNEEAQALLSQAAIRLLPTSHLEGSDDVSNEVANILLNEIRSKLHLKENDTSKSAIAQVQDYLSKELTRLAFHNADQSLVKARVGQRGDLRPDLYVVETGPAFEDANPSFKREQAAAIVKRPDDFQHLIPKRFSVEQDNPQYSSLFIKHYGGRHKHTVLVDGHRKGDKIFVVGAYRIFHDEVIFELTSTPLQILMAFTQMFGVPFEVSGVPFLRVLFVDEEIVVPKDLEEYPLFGMVGHGLQRSSEIHAAMGQEIVEGDVKITPIHLAFSIDTDLYHASLREHGYRV